MNLDVQTNRVEFEINGRDYSLVKDDARLMAITYETADALQACGASMAEIQNGNIGEANATMKEFLHAIEMMEKTINTAFGETAMHDIFAGAEPVQGITQVFMAIAKTLGIDKIETASKR